MKVDKSIKDNSFLILFSYFVYQAYASVLHDDESASVEVADGLLIDLLAYLEARLAFLSVIPVACWRCARTL